LIVRLIGLRAELHRSHRARDGQRAEVNLDREHSPPGPTAGAPVGSAYLRGFSLIDIIP
jgi:hypothetical protein